MNFSSRTTSLDVQRNLEANVEKRTKDNFGPPLGKKLLVFIDDMNMPQVGVATPQVTFCLISASLWIYMHLFQITVFFFCIKFVLHYGLILLDTLILHVQSGIQFVTMSSLVYNLSLYINSTNNDSTYIQCCFIKPLLKFCCGTL